MNEQDYLEAGQAAWRRQDWQEAINLYQKAIDLNPQSPAVEFRRMAIEVLDFYNKDMYNP